MPAKKKKKPKKATKELASSAAARKKQTETPAEVLELFLHRVQVWMDSNYSRVVDVFRTFDLDGDGLLSHEEFTIGMRELNAPLTMEEIGWLLGMIDRDNNGQIDLMEFEQAFKGMKGMVIGNEEEEDLPSHSLLVQERVQKLIEGNRSEKCPHCMIGLPSFPVDTNPKFVNIRMILAPFQHIDLHPGHFTINVTTATTVHGLIEATRKHLGYSMHHLVAIFSDASCQKADRLAPHQTLEVCGVQGAKNRHLSRRELYYDFGTEFNDCPILMAENGIRDVDLEAQTTQFGSHHRTPIKSTKQKT